MDVATAPVPASMEAEAVRLKVTSIRWFNVNGTSAKTREKFSVPVLPPAMS
jgi:hypothetical protein